MIRPQTVNLELEDLSGLYNKESKTEQYIKQLESKCNSLQAALDEMMLEYCPNDMTYEQYVDWGNHQKKIE